jgi:hypothetical protein
VVSKKVCQPCPALPKSYREVVAGWSQCQSAVASNVEVNTSSVKSKTRRNADAPVSMTSEGFMTVVNKEEQQEEGII